MGRKDIAEKHFEEINKIFADIINGTLFDGNQTIKEDELFDLPMKSQYKADSGKLHEQERDIAKRWSREDVVFSIIGIENQTIIDKDMALRVVGYDGASYRSQLLEKGSARRYPVITIVLYYGKEPWNAPRSLKERLDVPDCLDKYVSDYHINVFDISHMTNEEINNFFHSDFKMLAKVMNGTDDPSEFEEKVQYPDQLLKILSVLTGDNRFEALKGEFKEGGSTTMCELLDKVVNESSKAIARRMIEDGMKPSDVSKYITDLPKDEIQEIFNSITTKADT